MNEPSFEVLGQKLLKLYDESACESELNRKLKIMTITKEATNHGSRDMDRVELTVRKYLHGKPSWTINS